jgi:hypothetical protein
MLIVFNLPTHRKGFRLFILVCILISCRIYKVANDYQFIIMFMAIAMVKHYSINIYDHAPWRLELSD